MIQQYFHKLQNPKKKIKLQWQI